MKSEKISQEITLASCYDTIKNLTNLDDINIKDMLEFEQIELTSKTARQYIDLMYELANKINTMSANLGQKEKLRSILIWSFSNMCEKDCKGILYSNAIQKIKKYKERLDELYENFQKERDEHNELRRKYNEKEKEKIVHMPGVSVSITLQNYAKPLNPSECRELMNELDIIDKQFEDKYKRVSVPNDYKNKVNRAYIKKSEVNQILQK